MGFEPTTFSVTGRRALRAAPRGLMSIAGFKGMDAIGVFRFVFEICNLQIAWSGIRTHTRSLLRRAARPIGVSRQISGGGNRTDVSWFKARHVAITPPRNDLPSEPPISSRPFGHRGQTRSLVLANCESEGWDSNPRCPAPEAGGLTSFLPFGSGQSRNRTY